MIRIRRWLIVGMALAAVGLLVSCGGKTATTAGSGPSATGRTSSDIPPPNLLGGTTLTATEQDFMITLHSGSVGHGTVTFEVANDGPSKHQFVIFRTDLEPDKLPLSNKQVDESGQGVEQVDAIEGIGPGEKESLQVELIAGHYVIVCNISGHYESGMRAELTVT
jgi:uncharacterized cupredoxin-like copper-binding protein